MYAGKVSGELTVNVIEPRGIRLVQDSRRALNSRTIL